MSLHMVARKSYTCMQVISTHTHTQKKMIYNYSNEEDVDLLIQL
jgi:hypothetical protein